uniref:DUF659 domain-containing protein n=1 Tax=Cajanus cajan TaxID=3821 RepID=A0A151TZ65_CAJCA|nr:hypothetical protein KK1_004961 [Cajanus cajan]
MVEAIGIYGSHLRTLSYHELRVSLLKKELEYTKGSLKGHEEERVKYGCSIMSDGWTDRKNMAADGDGRLQTTERDRTRSDTNLNVMMVLKSVFTHFLHY